MQIPFHPLSIADRELIQSRVWPTEYRNCDLNFANLFTWRFLYDTEVALHRDMLLFRFKADGHWAYQAPVGAGDWQGVMADIVEDFERLGAPFLMLGVTEASFHRLETAMPDYFYATCDRSYTDYIYARGALATLAGKKLQPKRNHANRFAAAYPDYELLELTPALLPECKELEQRWAKEKGEQTEGRLTYEAEQRSLFAAFEHWEALGCQGAALRVDGKIVAFTYGAPVNYDTFDVCAEKADTAYEGAYAVINRDFVRSLPENFIHINREEDLGIEGLRKAKLSYQPEFLLHKFTVMTKHPMAR